MSLNRNDNNDEPPPSAPLLEDNSNENGRQEDAGNFAPSAPPYGVGNVNDHVDQTFKKMW